LIRKAALVMIVISAGMNVEPCISMAADDCRESVNIASDTIEQVVNKHTDELMSIPGVVGVGQGLCDNKPCIKVYIIENSLETDTKIPSSLDGYKVSTEVTGEIWAHPDK